MTSKNVYQRLADAMGEVDYIQKEKKNGMNYTIVSHDAVTAKVRPVLLRNGIVYFPVRCEHNQEGNRAECSMTVRFVNIDEPTDFFEVPTFGYGIDAQDKGPGKAMSYAVKYALLKALGLETGDDPDYDSVDHKPAPAAKKAPPPSSAKADPKAMSDAEMSLWTELSSINSIRGLQSFWTDNSKTVLGFDPALQKQFVDLKNSMKATFDAANSSVLNAG